MQIKSCWVNSILFIYFKKQDLNIYPHIPSISTLWRFCYNYDCLINLMLHPAFRYVIKKNFMNFYNFKVWYTWNTVIRNMNFWKKNFILFFYIIFNVKEHISRLYDFKHLNHYFISFYYLLKIFRGKFIQEISLLEIFLMQILLIHYTWLV